MLEIMPAQPGAQPEMAQGVSGEIYEDSQTAEIQRIVSAKNVVEYIAHEIVEKEVELVAEELVLETSAFLEAFEKARIYAVAAHYYGMHSWN